MFVTHLIFERVKRQKKTHREGRAGAEAGACGQVRNVMDFHSGVDAHELEAGADGRMLDLIIAGDIFHFRIRDAAVILEKGWQSARGDVAGLVDGGGQDGTAMFAVPDRVVGAAAEKGDAHGSASDDHCVAPKVRAERLGGLALDGNGPLIFRNYPQNRDFPGGIRFDPIS